MVNKKTLKVIVHPDSVTVRPNLRESRTNDFLTGLGYLPVDPGYPPFLEKRKPFTAYCPISLTHVPPDAKSILESRQNLLKNVLEQAGITPYDPYTSEYSPHKKFSIPTNEVFKYDILRVAESRFFTGHHIISSTGMGEEFIVALQMVKIAVIFHDKNIRVSRMQQPAIRVSYDQFDLHIDDFVDMFKMLQKYEPGIGVVDDYPVLLGFKENEIVHLENLVHSTFPKIRYEFNLDLPIVETKVTNPEIFYELRDGKF